MILRRNTGMNQRQNGYKDYNKSEIYEGQIMITNNNISSIDEYIVESRRIRQAIIEQYEA
jgi:hypothetical protein